MAIFGGQFSEVFLCECSNQDLLRPKICPCPNLLVPKMSYQLFLSLFAFHWCHGFSYELSRWIIIYSFESPHVLSWILDLRKPRFGRHQNVWPETKKVLLTSPAPTITKQIWPPRSHLITMLPGKMVYCGRLPSQKLGVPGNISGEIFKRNYQCFVRSSGSIQHIWLLWTSMIVQWSFQAPKKSFCEGA